MEDNGTDKSPPQSEDGKHTASSPQGLSPVSSGSYSSDSSSSIGPLPGGSPSATISLSPPTMFINPGLPTMVPSGPVFPNMTMPLGLGLPNPAGQLPTNINTTPPKKSSHPECPEGELILDVECGPNKAQVFLTKLCQGSKGPCVLYNQSWLTPNEFQYVSGRETAKDWKRSIRHHGKSMKLLMAKGIMTLNPPTCRCEGCTGVDPLANVSIFTIFFPET